MVASKNFPAPGKGAAAYSVAKAGQTQLDRVAALELVEKASNCAGEIPCKKVTGFVPVTSITNKV